MYRLLTSRRRIRGHYGQQQRKPKSPARRAGHPGLPSAKEASSKSDLVWLRIGCKDWPVIERIVREAQSFKEVEEFDRQDMARLSGGPRRTKTDGGSRRRSAFVATAARGRPAVPSRGPSPPSYPHSKKARHHVQCRCSCQSRRCDIV